MKSCMKQMLKMLDRVQDKMEGDRIMHRPSACVYLLREANARIQGQKPDPNYCGTETERALRMSFLMGNNITENLFGTYDKEMQKKKFMLLWLAAGIIASYWAQDIRYYRETFETAEMILEIGSSGYIQLDKFFVDAYSMQAAELIGHDAVAWLLANTRENETVEAVL